MASRLPEELKLFIARHVETVGQLEVLLLLYRDADRAWQLPELTRELRGNRDSIARWLGMWRAHGLVLVEDGHFRYQASSPELHRCAGDLAKAYLTSPEAVIEHIYHRPNPQLQDFVRAFEIRKHLP